MALKSEQVTVAVRGNIYAAEFGVDLPTGLEDLDSGSGSGSGSGAPDWINLGYTTADGVTFTVTPDVENIDSWQSASPIRRLVTARNVSASFQGLQWNADTFALAFGGGEWTEESGSGEGVFTYEPPADDAPLSEYSLVIDFVDGEKEGRIVIRKGNVSEGVETNLVRTTAALLPVTFSGLTPDNAKSAWYGKANAALLGEVEVGSGSG